MQHVRTDFNSRKDVAQALMMFSHEGMEVMHPYTDQIPSQPNEMCQKIASASPLGSAATGHCCVGEAKRKHY
jgi:hypothetical protein